MQDILPLCCLYFFLFLFLFFFNLADELKGWWGRSQMDFCSGRRWFIEWDYLPTGKMSICQTPKDPVWFVTPFYSACWQTKGHVYMFVTGNVRRWILPLVRDNLNNAPFNISEHYFNIFYLIKGQIPHGK